MQPLALLAALAVMATITLLVISVSHARGAAQRALTRRLEHFSGGERSLPGVICGPGRLAQCHVADEYLDTDQLLLASQVYAQMLVDWCG